MAILGIVPSAQLNFSIGFYLIQTDFMQSSLTLSITIGRIASPSIMKCRMVALSKVTFSTTAFSILIFSFIKLSIRALTR